MTALAEPACEDIRRRLLSEPTRPDAPVREHLADCAACRSYAHDLQAFESRLQRALQIDLPPSSAQLIDLAARRPNVASPRWLALAASVLIVIGVFSLWLSWPEPALARDVVQHVLHEPQAWTPAAAPMRGAQVDAVLRNAGVKLGGDGVQVSYANACEFRGHVVPHLVVRVPQGPVTVMILAHDNVKSAMNFDEEGYRGTIVPVPGHGSIALITRGAPVELAPVLQTVMQQLVWLPPAG